MPRAQRTQDDQDLPGAPVAWPRTPSRRTGHTHKAASHAQMPIVTPLSSKKIGLSVAMVRICSRNASRFLRFTSVLLLEADIVALGQLAHAYPAALICLKTPQCRSSENGRPMLFVPQSLSQFPPYLTSYCLDISILDTLL